MILANSKFTIIPFRFDAFKIFVNDSNSVTSDANSDANSVLYGTNVTY